LTETDTIYSRPLPADELEQEFDRSGLPKTALAGMLSVTKAIVTRLVKGTRELSPGEAITARSFFALVPEKIDSPFAHGVRLLRNSEILAEVANTLVAYTDLESEFGLQVDSPLSELRADTIVYACRIACIDLERLVRSSRLAPERDPGRLELFDQSIDELYRRANEGEFLQRARKSPPPRVHSTRSSGSRQRALPLISDKLSVSSHIENLSPLLPGTAVNLSSAENCTNWVVINDSLKPRYRKGETILVAPTTAGYRHGDDVVIQMTDENTVVGQHLFESRDELVIEHPQKGRISIPRQALVTVGRIAFVVR
jgi:hypothetical protein